MAVKHKDAYAYHLYIDGKQTDVNVDYFNEDGGAEAYAKAYPGASIRMRDEQGKDYNVPLEKMGFARTKGLHPFKMQYVKEYTEDDVSDWLMPGQEDKTEAANAIRQNGTIIDSIAPNEVKENKEVKAVPVVATPNEVKENNEVKAVPVAANKEVKDTMPVTSAAVMPVADTTARRGDGSMLARPADTSQVVNDSIVNPIFRPDSISAPNAVGKVEVDSAYNAPKGDSRASYYDSLVQYYIDEEGYDLTGAKEKALGKILQEERAADKRLQENKEVRASESAPANAPIIPAVANAWRGSKNVTEAQSNKAYAWDSEKGEWSNPKLLEDYQRNAARMYGHAQPEEMRGMPITERDAEYVWAYSPEEYREMLADAREEMKRGQRPSVITDLEEDYAKAVAYSKGESAEKPLHWDYWRKREGLEAPVIDYRSRLDGGVTPTKKQEPTYNANDGSILAMNIEKEDSNEQSNPSYVGGEVTSQLLGDIAQQSAEVQRAKDVKVNADYEAQAATPFIEEDAKKVYQEVKATQNERAWEAAEGVGGAAFMSPMAKATAQAREMAQATSLEDAIEKSVTKVVDNAIAKGGVADIISAYVNNGFSAEQAQNMAIENIATRTQQTIFDEYKAQRAPKGTLDYIMSAAMHNSIVGSLAQGFAGIDDTATQLNEEAIAEASEKEGMLARVAGGVGSLVLDAPAFAMGGGIGGAVSKGATNLLSKGAAKMALKASGELGVEAGSRYLASSLTGRIAQSSIASGTTLGAYDAMAEGARQFRVKDLDLGAIVNRASHGFALGAMLGPIGQGSKYLSRKMSAKGKMMVDAGAFVTEAEVFNLGGSLLSGEKIDASTHGEGFVESALTLLAMKGTHLIANPGGLKASIKARYNSPDYPNKARMTAEDLALMKSLGYDINTIFKVTKRGEGVKAEDGAIDVNAEFANAEEVRNNAVKSDKEFLENYANMMKDANVPMEIKAKLALRVEGKIVESLPKATGMREIKTADGIFAVETLSSNGEVITRREFSKKADADKLAQEMMNVCEANSYELMERAVDATQSEIGLQDVFNKIAAERGADAREIANEIYEISRKKESERTPEDQALMNAFEATVVEVRDTMRTSEDIKSLVERTTGLNVEDILKKSADKRTLEEVEALAIYRRELLKSVGAKTYEAAEGAETVTPDVKEVKDAAPVADLETANKEVREVNEVKETAPVVAPDKEIREVAPVAEAPKAEVAPNRVSIEDVIELFGRDDASAEMMRKDADSYADTIEDLEADRQEAVAYSRGDGEKPIYWDYWKERDGLAEPVVKTDKEINEMPAAPEAPKAEETALVADREVNKAEKTAVKPESNRYGVEYSQIETRTNAWNERTGVTTKVVTDVDAITNNEARAAITEGRRITGWYEVATGDVVIYAPNVVNMDEVDKTYVHEVVSHKGINGLLGEKYAGEFYDKVYNDVMNDAERERFNNYAGVGGIKDEKKRHRVAAEEYVANLAEKPEYDMTAEERITWQQIVEYIRTIINKILGNGKLTHQDIKDTLRAAYQKLRYEAEAKRGAAPVVTDKEVREVNEVKKPAPVVEAKANATTLFNSPKKRKRNYKTKVIMPRSGKDITRHAHSSVEFAKALEAEYADAPSEVRDLISHIAPLDEYIDAEDAVYGALGSKNKLILQSDGVRIGVAEELGLPPKELQKALGINAFASRANGGVSLQELAERVAESAFDSYDKERIEAPEVRNMLIEAIYSVTEPADLAYYRANRRIQEAQKIYDEYMEQERAWRDEWESREDAYEAMVISDLEAKEKASKDLPENYFDNKFADELNENSYGQSRNNTTIGRGNKILHEEQIGDRRGIGESQGRAGLQQEVGNRMRSENEVSQEGIVSKASEWSLGSKERNNSITTAEGKSVSIKGYPEELFESEQPLSDVEIKDRKRIYRDYKNVLSMDELRELNQLNSEIDNRDEALKKAVDAFLANKVSRQELEAMAKQYDAIINRRSELFQKAHELKAETKRGAAPVTPNKEVKETAIAGGRISREDAEAAIARGEEKRLKAEGIRFADRTDYSDMLVKAAEKASGTRFRFVGEKGAEALDKAYERTTLRDNLNVAREMELSGKDARTIKLATGWERGADGKWRLEQADELDLKNGVKSNKLKDYITAPELFKAYPALQNVEVKFEDLGGNTFGLWNSRDTFLSAPTQQEGVILIHDKLSEDAIKKVLAHEIQHAIQYYEGFESGANVDTVNPKKAEQISKNKQIAKERIAEYTKERDKINNELSSLNDKMEDWYNRNGDAEFDAEMTAYQKRYNELQEQYDAVAENIRFNRNWLDAFDRADLSLGREGYRRVMGEVESRNVESRLGMTAEERKNSLAIDTEDVAREDQILIAGKDSGYSGDYGVRFSVREEEAELDRINARFNEELQQQINGTLPKGYIYQLGMPSMVLRSTGIPMLPIQLNSMRLEEKSKNFGHDFELSEVKDLVKAISAPVAVFAYGNKGKAQNIVVEIQHEGKNFIVGLSISPSVGGRVLNINSIRNVFPKDNAEWLNWINQGKALYLNKEKIQNLIDQQRTNLADVDYLDLDSITKVIESFENPTIQDGILFREKELDEEYERVAPEADIDSERYSRGEITAQEYFDVVNDFNDVLSRRSALYEKAHRLKDKANGGSIRYSSRESNDRNLVGLHNLTESNLAHVEKMGGIANPSMAVVNRDIATLDNFGEITLIAPKSLIDKRAGKNAGTWGADAYSPRYPRVEYRFSDKAYDELFSRGRAAGMADYEISRLKQKIEDYGKRWLVGDRDVLELFAYEGKPGERIDEYVDNLVDGLTLDERIFRGYTPMGNRRYVSHTLENVSRIMKSEGRAGAEGSFGMGSVRATLTPIFKTIAQIGKNRDRIVSHEEFEKAKESLEERFYELSRLTNTGKYDYASEDRLGEAMLHSNPKLYLSKEYGIEISDAESDAIRTLAADLRVMPAEYFETKFERPVKLYEFVGAVIPKDATAKTRRILKEAGIDYLEYDRGIPGDRLRAVRRASEGEGIRFREGGMPWNEGESLMDALDRNYKRKSKLEIAVANMERKRDAGRSIDEDEYNAMKAELTKIREDIRFMQNGPTQPTLQHGETIYDESFANRMEAWREDLAAWKDKKYDADVMLDQLLQSTTGERATMTDEELREILEAESDKIDATIKETKTLIKDQIISRVSNIGVRYWDDVVKVKDIKSKTTAEERKLMPHLLEGSYDIIPNKGEMYHEYVEERRANNPDLIELGEYDDVSTDVAVYDAPATGNKHGIKHSDVIDYAVEGSTKVFTIEPYQHTRRDGRVRDMYTISFGRKLSKNEVEQANSYLAEHKAGWHRASINGFVVRDEDVARAIANLLSGGESITNTLRKVWVGKGNHGMIEFEDGTFFPLYPFDMEYLAWRESKGASVPKEMMSDVEESLLNQFLHNEIETYLPNGIRDFMDVKYIDAHTLDVMNEVREWYDDLWYEMEALGMNFGKEKRDFYVTHIWDKKKSTPTSITTAQKFALATKPKDIVDVESYVATNTPYMRTRMFDSLLDGMALGLVPKYEDIADIILDYGHRAAEAIENRKMVKFLKMLTVNGIPALREVGGRNEGIYTVINNNALRGYEVLKDVKPLLNVIFGPTHSSESAGWQAVGKGYDIVGGLAKKIELSLSFFHHGALTETAIAMNGPFRTMKIVGKHLMWDCIKNGDIPAFNDPELTRDAVKHLVVLGATQDYATKDVQMATEKIVEWTRKIHGVHEAAKLVDFINKGSDKILWDYLHDGLKVYAYEKMAKEIRARAEREGIDNETLEKMLNEAGQLVNDTFGGQHWELLGWEPKTVKWARRALLSPDWTMSTIRQALAPIGVGQLYNDEAFWKKYFKGDDVASVRKQYGRAFWLRAALFAIPLVTGINMCNRLEDEEEQKAIADEKRKTDPNYLSPYEMAYPDGMKWYDYTMYGNTVGHSTHLFMGRYEDGSEQYLRWGKQFRELPELMFGPDGFGFPDPLIHKMVGKLNPMVDAFINLMSGNSFTGWVNEDMKDKEGWDKNLGRLTYLGKKFIPFAWNLDATTEFKPIDLLMPSTKGFSRGKAIKQFKVAIMNDDKDYAKLVMDACKMNGLNGDQLLETAWKVLEAEGRKNMVEGVETVDDAISQYDAEANPERREQLKYFIMRQMSLRDIRMISNEQAVEQAWNTLMTAGDNSKADKFYNTINSSEDVLQDWRMSRVMAELKPFKAEYNKQETYDEAEAYYNEHKAEIDKYEDLLEARRYINEYKRAMGNDADNAELLRLIREERKKALGIKEN